VDPETETEATVTVVDVLTEEGAVEVRLPEQASRSQPAVTRARRTAPRRPYRVNGVTLA
jgi:hypothetical protein